MPEAKDGCVKPARGPMLKPTGPTVPPTGTPAAEEVRAMVARVGQEAPDFEANAYVAEGGFKTVRLSEYKGRWIVLCFYPGDFTFV